MNKTQTLRLRLAASLMVALATTNVEAAIWYVDGSKSTNGTGGSWTAAFNNLHSALNNTSLASSDQIWVKAGTYKPGTLRSDAFVLRDGVRIFGGFAGTEGPTQLSLRDPVANVTTLSGDIGTANDSSDNCFHVVKATGKLEFPSTVLDGFRIRDGNADDPRFGQEIRGGGIYIESTSSGEQNACRPLVVRCVFLDNDASGVGGAAAAVGAIVGTDAYICEPSFINCAFLGNAAADDGGAVAAAAATPTFMNCVFSGNDSASRGGAIASLSLSSVHLANCTFSANSAVTTGGVASVGGGFGGAGTIDATNTIMWGNTGGSTTETAQISTGSTVNFCCIQGLSTLGGIGNIGSSANDDPDFVDANGADNVTGTADDDLRLHSASPCNDVGYDAAVLADVGDLDYNNDFTEPTPYDIAATRRFAIDDAAGVLGPCDGMRVDMGAYENGDCDGDGTPDEQETDSNHDGIPDACQDCNGDSVLDPEQIEGNDCNGNGRLDECDIALGCSLDVNENGVPDECECPVDVVFVVDVSGSMSSGSGGGAPELEEVCDMIAAIESALSGEANYRFARVAPFSTNRCITEDLVGAGLPPDEASMTCDGLISYEDTINAIEVVAGHFGWRQGATKVIVPIFDEGGPCIESTCLPTHPAVVAAINAAEAANCYVFAISGVWGDPNPPTDSCSDILADALVAGTCAVDRSWHADVPNDYVASAGIGDQLIVALQVVALGCLCPCPADLDGDRVVGASDLAVLLGAWGPCGACCPADIEVAASPGVVGSADLAVLLGAWGDCGCGYGDMENQSMTAGSGWAGGDSLGNGSPWTPEALAAALGFADVDELAQYLGSLDFETMQAMLESYFG